MNSYGMRYRRLALEHLATAVALLALGAFGCLVDPPVSSDCSSDRDCLKGYYCDLEQLTCWPRGSSCVDHDGDGYGMGTCAGEDCDDADGSIWRDCSSCVDADGDLHGVGCSAGDDCSDTDVNNWASCATCADGDGDSHFRGCDAYTTIYGPDCDDTNPAQVGCLLCGNGNVDEGEECDGNCPTTCGDTLACTSDALVGSADDCSARCTHTEITTCTTATAAARPRATRRATTIASNTA